MLVCERKRGAPCAGRGNGIDFDGQRFECLSRVPAGISSWCSGTVTPEGRAGAWRSSITQRAAWSLERRLLGEPSDTVVIDGVAPTSHSALGTADHAERLRRMGAAMHAGQMTGALERCLEQSLRYAADRRQFGRPIAKFQAVQHSLAVFAGEVAAATTSADAAVSAISRHGIEDERTFLAVATVKTRGGPGGGRLAPASPIRCMARLASPARTAFSIAPGDYGRGAASSAPRRRGRSISAGTSRRNKCE